MKTRLALLFCLALTSASFADEPAAPALAPDSNRLTAEQLEQLLSPIALYPDALIAIILPAATAPADIVLAARYLKDGGDPGAVGSRSWDESVKSLVHYAEVVKWMDDNLAWTKQVGEAFREQPAEVMQAVQRLRAKARAAGTLRDSPQQQVLVDSDVITIVPAQSNYLYVPYYDPLVVYAPPQEYFGTTTFITFSSPFAVGPWLRYDCDWRQRTVWTAERHWASPNRHDWRHPVFPGQPGYVHDPNRHPWRPPTNSPRMPIVNSNRRYDIARPAPINAAPRPTFTDNDRPARRGDAPNWPQRNDTRNRDSILDRPAAFAPTAVAPVTTASIAFPTPTTTPPPAHRSEAGRTRNDAANRPNRAISFQNPPAARPAPANVATVIAAPATRSAPSNYPFGAPPASRIVPAFVGPVVQSMPPPPATNPQQMRMPAPAPAPSPAAPAPEKAQSDDHRRGRGDREQKQLN